MVAADDNYRPRPPLGSLARAPKVHAAPERDGVFLPSHAAGLRLAAFAGRHDGLRGGRFIDDGLDPGGKLITSSTERHHLARLKAHDVKPCGLSSRRPTSGEPRCL